MTSKGWVQSNNYQFVTKIKPNQSPPLWYCKSFKSRRLSKVRVDRGLDRGAEADEERAYMRKVLSLVETLLSSDEFLDVT